MPLRDLPQTMHSTLCQFYRERLRRGCRRPLNGVRHTETVPWQLHLKKVLDCFGDLWRWMSLDRSGQLWTAALRKQFSFVLAGYGRFWAGSAGLWAALACSGRLWEALGSVLDCSGRLGSSGGALGGPWQGFGRRWTGPWKQLWSGSGRLWTVLTGSEEVWTVLDGSGRRWTALDGLESFGWQPGACSQLAECRKSCSY